LLFEEFDKNLVNIGSRARSDKRQDSIPFHNKKDL